MNSRGSNDPRNVANTQVFQGPTPEGLPNVAAVFYPALGNPSGVGRRRGKCRVLTGGFVPQPPAIHGEPLRGSVCEMDKEGDEQ